MKNANIQDWLKPEIILTIYASIISTITLIWNIIIAVMEKSSRLKVSVEFRDSYIGDISNSLVQGPKICFIRMVNKGNQIKYISSINIRLPYKTATGNMFSIIKPEIKFPIEILPQQEYVFKHKFMLLQDVMLENYKNGNCKIIVFDTIRKRYKSNSFKSKKVKEVFEYNNSLSESIHLIFK